MSNDLFKLPDNIPDYERGFIDGMQEQMRRSVDKAVNAMATQHKEWQGLTGQEVNHLLAANVDCAEKLIYAVEAKLKEKNA